MLRKVIVNFFFTKHAPLPLLLHPAIVSLLRVTTKVSLYVCMCVCTVNALKADDNNIDNCTIILSLSLGLQV